MTSLIKYEAARRALAEAHGVDEVKDIRDKAAAMQLYAMQAKDRELVDMATEIKLRAERRAGELLRDMPKNKGTRGAGNPDFLGGSTREPPRDNTPKLSDLDITKKESSRWQKLAAMPEKQFEEKVTGVKKAMREKTEGKPPKPKATKQQPSAPKRHYKEDSIIALADDGATITKIAEKTGIGKRAVRHVVERERIRREAKAEPVIERADLSITAQQKLDAAIRQHQRSLDLQFEKRVSGEYRKRVDEIFLPHIREKIEQAQKLYNARRALMTKDTFNIIRRALHPDSRHSISDKKLGEAFDAFMSLEKYLLNEKDSPTDFGDIPSTLAEWDKTRAQKQTKRQQGGKGMHNPLRPS